MKKQFNLEQWVNDRITKLKIDAKKAKFKDRLWMTIFLIINVLTICAATFALVLLFLYNSEKKISLKGNISLIVTIITLIFIILTFFLQVFNKIYATRMRDKIYLISINKLKLEIVKYNNQIGKYHETNREKLLEDFVDDVERDILKFEKTKLSLRQAFIATATRSK